MGIYLSTPIKAKGVEEGSSSSSSSTTEDGKGTKAVAFAVVDMQGWRNTMEDAHTTKCDIRLPEEKETKHELTSASTSSTNRMIDQDDHENNNEGGHQNDHNNSSSATAAHVFGVFDGHGGAEVARFCQLYLVDVLTRQTTWSQALRQTHGDPKHTTVPSVPSLRNYAKSTPMGQALCDTFHALDRMIDDPRRRDELNHLRSYSPKPGETRISTEIFSLLDPSNINSPDNKHNNSNSTQQQDDKAINEGEECNHQNDKRNSSAPDKTMANSIDTTQEGKAKDDEDEQIISIEVEKQTTSSSGSNNKFIPPTYVYKHGRQMCNLPDHPVRAGATAVVAVITGDTLTVANAGDSRAVLCRKDGQAEALSEDHKPEQSREKLRIMRAGGFVNNVGRINGNLNLSRSIGDLKYKQVGGLAPAEQMITAEPDIVQIKIRPDDEFIILGCDGIWDCLSNAKAVKFVRERIDSKILALIGVEMLNGIISTDPRLTQGIGSDNMTVMIIDLLPSKRKRG
mmetsp:Transcript_14393/g.20707  ORF Transcript_14393/g.20707 Transcript_14393/m.20707 type:complete len:511 (-) Transcript_14393:396-1928(-)